MIDSFLMGVIFTLYMTAALYFLRFWRSTLDRLFLAFAVAFGIEGVNRCVLLFLDDSSEGNTGVYGVRLLAYLLILVAIVSRNMTQKRPANR